MAETKKELDKAADWCRSRFVLQLKKVSGVYEQCNSKSRVCGDSVTPFSCIY